MQLKLLSAVSPAQARVASRFIEIQPEAAAIEFPQRSGTRPGIGVLTTHKEFCANQHAADTGLRVAPGPVGSPTPQPGSTPVSACSQFCGGPSSCYGLGVLRTQTNFCAGGAAIDTGLRVP